MAKKQGIAWPVAPVLERAVRDVEASWAAAQIVMIDYRRHGPWLGSRPHAQAF